MVDAMTIIIFVSQSYFIENTNIDVKEGVRYLKAQFDKYYCYIGNHF